MDIQPVWKRVLEDLDIYSWYKALVAAYSEGQPFADHSITEAQEMIREFGYPKAVYDARTGYYTVEVVEEVRSVKGLGSGISISLKGGVVEVGMIFDLDNDLKEGGKLHQLYDRLGYEPLETKPVFSNYKELYAILKQIFEKYNDICNKIIDLYLEEPASVSYL
ncbi:hypothetical protein ACWKWU_20870 [Chitinophaga lutea]